MKNLFFLLFLICSATIVAQQIPAHHYSILTKDYNDKNNPVAREYKRTGNLPNGWKVLTVSELLKSMSAKELWAIMSPAAPHNRQVNGGIFMAHHEKLLIDPRGTIHSAVYCANLFKEYKLIYAQEKVVVQEKPSCKGCKNNTTLVVNGEITETASARNGQIKKGRGYTMKITSNN